MFCVDISNENHTRPQLAHIVRAIGLTIGEPLAHVSEQG